MIVRNLAEQLRAHPTDFHPLLLLVDIRKAYPRVPRSLAWQLFSRLGFPPLLLRQLQGLHDHAHYAIQTPAGTGRTYTNSRGFREGCPSSLACFNVFHTFPLKQFTAERHSKRGAAPLRGGLQWNKPFSKVTRPKSARENHLEVHLDDVLFADDTTVYTTLEHFREDEEHLRQVMATWGEDLHADKTERLPLGISPAEAARISNRPEQSFQRQAKFLGAWITTDASQRIDTEKASTTSQTHLVQTMATTSTYQHSRNYKRPTLQINSFGITLLQRRRTRIHSRRNSPYAGLCQQLHFWDTQCKAERHARQQANNGGPMAQSRHSFSSSGNRQPTNSMARAFSKNA